MRIIIFLLVVSFMIKPAFSQVPARKTEMPTNKGMQGGIMEAINELNTQIADLEKQIAEAKKNKEDKETIKQLEDQLAMLKKQVAMMGGLNKGVGNMSAKTFQQASEEGNNVIPKRDVARINKLPKKIFSDAELVSYVKTVFTEVEELIPAAEKIEAAKIYNTTKSEYKSANALNSAASGCWMYGHQEKALWITGKACIDYQGNPDLLDNYAAFLIMTGAEQAAIPILSYLNNKFPENSTILNNLGQAWFGLGDVVTSKKYLETATELYPTHSMANLTLSKIYLAEPDTAKAMAALKNSTRESYCAGKEQSLAGIGGALTLDDLPEFNYPIEKNPFRIESLFQTIPGNQGSLDDYANSDALWRGFEDAINEACKKAKMEADETAKEQAEFTKKMAEDIPFQQKILYTYNNSPSHALAKRYLLALAADEASMQNGSSLYYLKKTSYPISMMLSSNFSIAQGTKKKKPISLTAVWKILIKLTLDEMIKPAEALEVERKNKLKAIHTENDEQRCLQTDAINSEFLTKAESIQANWKKKIYQKYLELESRFDEFISIQGYAAETATVAAPDPAEPFINYFSNILSLTPYVHRPLFSIFMDSWKQLVTHRVTADHCSPPSKQKPAIRVRLPQTKQPDCPNKTTFSLWGIKIAFEWGRMVCDESQLKKLNSGETKGSAVSSKKQPSSTPFSLDEILGHGPSISSVVRMEDVSFSGPLVTGFTNPVDTTHRYIEFDNYGNFSDFKIPLNKEGTGFADSNSTETFDQRRWCWIACASGREKKLAGLFKKQ